MQISICVSADLQAVSKQQKLKYSAAVVCASQPAFRITRFCRMTLLHNFLTCYVNVSVNLYIVEFISNLIEYEREAIIFI